MIRVVDKKKYDEVIFRLDTIVITNRRGRTNGLYMPEKLWFTNKGAIEQDTIEELAAGLVHEAFHSSQFKNGMYTERAGFAREKPAIRAEEEFLKKVEKKYPGKSFVGLATKAYEKKYWKNMRKDTASYTHFEKLLDLLCDRKITMVRAR